MNPLPKNPSKQSHWKLPLLLAQEALEWQTPGDDEHSSISKIKLNTFLKLLLSCK